MILSIKYFSFYALRCKYFQLTLYVTLIFPTFSAIQQAQIIHDRMDDVLVIGVTSAVDVDEIQQLTSSPSMLNQNYFLLNDYSELVDLPAILATGLCSRDVTTPSKSR